MIGVVLGMGDSGGFVSCDHRPTRYQDYDDNCTKTESCIKYILQFENCLLNSNI